MQYSHERKYREISQSIFHLSQIFYLIIECVQFINKMFYNEMQKNLNSSSALINAHNLKEQFNG